MKQINVNGVELYAETSGNPADPPLLLIGVTIPSWPDELCGALAGVGQGVPRVTWPDVAEALLRHTS